MNFKSRALLELHTKHMVSVSAIDEETLIFCAQLLSLQNNLEQLMIQINNDKKMPIDEIPVNGSVCLGQLKDGQCYRSTVMGVKNDNLLKLYTVDYGTLELVPFSRIFQIKPEFIFDKVYAYRFALHGLLCDPRFSREVLYNFRNIVKDQILELEVMPSKDIPLVQYCNLYLDGNNVANLINHIVCAKNNISLPLQQITFTDLKVYKASKHNVLVSYIETISQFYIHLYEYKDQLDSVMEKLNMYCSSAPMLSMEDLKINMPCAALFPEDQIWYRAIILSFNKSDVKVKYVDYGNCETVDINCIKMISAELVSCLEAQALLCCLTGFENISENESTTTQLEMMCLEKILTMIVVSYDAKKNSFVIDLIDSNISPPLNISKRIIELSSPRQNRNNVITAENKGIADISSKLQYSMLPSPNKNYDKQNASHISNHVKKQPFQLYSDGKFCQSNVEECSISMKSEKKRFKENIMSGVHQVTVSWFINPHNFHCQLKENKEKLSNLMCQIQQRYRKLKNIGFNPTLGDSVIAKFRKDNTYYRGKILGIKKGNYVVDFVDYGFRNIVSFDEIYPIDDDLLNDSVFAIKCKIHEIIPKLNKTNLDHVYEFFKEGVYDCTFYNCDKQNFTLVELSHHGEIVGLKLVEYGFAILAKEILQDDIDFRLLHGQSIRGTVLGALNFQSIFVRLFGTNSQLECGLFNCPFDESSPEYSKLRKTFSDMIENNIFIIHINEVQNSRLLITLYDSLGSKISLFSSDDSIPALSPLCDKPVYKPHMQAIISYRYKELAYIQEETDLTSLSGLLDSLYEFYENEGSSMQSEYQEGSICAAKSMLDLNWYRAQILKINEDALFVKYLDYGNDELLPFENIRRLDTRYYESHKLCLEVCVGSSFSHGASDNVIDFNIVKELGVWKLSEVKEVFHKCLNISEICELVEAQHIGQSGDSEKTSEENLIEFSDQTKEFVNPDPSHKAVIVSHIDSPNQFWIQNLESLQDLTNMQEKLQNIADKLPSLTNLQVGKICVAKYSIDDQWYRSIILDADTDITTVRFIDHGHADVINNSDNLIKDLDGDFKTFEAFAKKCSLLLDPIGGEEWSENACYMFNSFVQSTNTLRVDIVINTDKCCYVELFSGDICISKNLIADGYAVSMQSVNVDLCSNTLLSDSDVLSQLKTGYISHFISLDEFYVQLECDRPGLEFLENALLNAESFPSCTNPVEDMVVIAQFVDDGLWYRASINKILSDCYEVFFIDFGNTGMTKNIREMPSSVDNIGQLAKQCYISIPEKMLHLGAEVGRKLQEISADGLTVFEIEFMSLGSPYKTQLKLNNENIVQKILSECNNIESQ